MVVRLAQDSAEARAPGPGSWRRKEGAGLARSAKALNAAGLWILWGDDKF